MSYLWWLFHLEYFRGPIFFMACALCILQKFKIKSKLFSTQKLEYLMGFFFFLCLIFCNLFSLMNYRTDFTLSQMDVYVCFLLICWMHCFVCLLPNTVLPQLLWLYVLIFENAHIPDLSGWDVDGVYRISSSIASETRWKVGRSKDLLHLCALHSLDMIQILPKAYRPPILVCLYLHITFSGPPIHCIPSSFSCSLMFPDLFQHKFAYCFSLELSSPGCCMVWVSLFKFEQRLLSLITFLSNFPCPLITH